MTSMYLVKNDSEFWTGGSWSRDKVDAALFPTRELARVNLLQLSQIDPDVILDIEEISAPEVSFACPKCGKAVPHVHDSSDQGPSQ